MATGWKKSIFILIPKKGNTKESANHWTTVLISHASKAMLKILNARLQHYVSQEIPDVQAQYIKGRGTRQQMANIPWIIEKARGFQKKKNIYLCFIDYAKAFDCVDHNKLWKALKDMGIPDHLTCLLRNLYVGQEVRVRTPYGINDWFKAEKGVRQSYLLSPCLFDLYAEQIMRKAELDELQEGIKIGRRNINNLRYTDDTILMAESEEELKSLLMRVKEESERARLKLNNENNNNKKTKIMVSAPITSQKIEGDNVEAVTDFLSLSSKIAVDGDLVMKSEDTCFLAGKL